MTTPNCRLNIAFTHHAFTFQRVGGISRYFVKLAEAIMGMGHHARVFATFHRNQFLRDAGSTLCQGRYSKSYVYGSRYAIYMMNQLLMCREIDSWDADVVHETYFLNIGCIGSRRAVVVTVYDMIHEMYPDLFRSGDPTAWFKRKACHRADHIIAISEQTKRDVVRIMGVEERKVTVVPLGVEEMSVGSSQFNSFSSNDIPPFILYVGARAGYKNFDGFIRGFSRSRRLVGAFRIIAFGGGGLTERERRLIGELGLPSNCVIQMNGSDEILGDLYRAARAFVYPSLYEGFGLPPIEAMVHGCPVISSNAGPMPEVIGRAAEYFDPTSVEAITEAIERVVWSDVRVDELRLLGLERAAQFTWKRCASDTLAVYRNLVGRASS